MSLNRSCLPHAALRALLTIGTISAAVCADGLDSLGRWDIPKPSIRLSLGTCPAIDDSSGNAYYNGQHVAGVSGGGSWFQSDARFNPAIAVEVIGPGASAFSADESRFGVALGWNRRVDGFSLDGYETPDIRIDTFGLSLLGGRSWQLGGKASFEALGRIGGGFLRSREYIIAPDTASWELAGDGRGGFIEAAVRGALLWTEGPWLFGAQLEYAVGAGRAKWDEAGTLGDSTGTTRYAWYGFGASVVIGREF